MVVWNPGRQGDELLLDSKTFLKRPMISDWKSLLASGEGGCPLNLSGKSEPPHSEHLCPRASTSGSGVAISKMWTTYGLAGA